MKWCILVDNVCSKHMIVLSQNDSIFLLSKLFYFVVSTTHTHTDTTWAFFDTHLKMCFQPTLTEYDGVKSTILYQVLHIHCATRILTQWYFCNLECSTHHKINLTDLPLSFSLFPLSKCVCEYTSFAKRIIEIKFSIKLN